MRISAGIGALTATALGAPNESLGGAIGGATVAALVDSGDVVLDGATGRALCAMIALAAAIESARCCAATAAAFGTTTSSRGCRIADTGGSGSRRASQICTDTKVIASAIATEMPTPTQRLRIGNAPTA